MQMVSLDTRAGPSDWFTGTDYVDTVGSSGASRVGRTGTESSFSAGGTGARRGVSSSEGASFHPCPRRPIAVAPEGFRPL
jgi:hypothetical protein